MHAYIFDIVPLICYIIFFWLDKIWMFGGSSNASLESFDGSNWNLEFKLPRTLSQHCVVHLKNEFFLVIGGKCIRYTNF